MFSSVVLAVGAVGAAGIVLLVRYEDRPVQP